MSLLSAVLTSFISTAGFTQDQQAEIIQEQVIDRTYSAENCVVRQTCGLKRLRWIDRKLRFKNDIDGSLEDEIFSQFQVVLDFDQIKDIERFGVVQWIRGCQYESTRNPNGSVRIAYTLIHEHHGRRRLVHHPRAVIDSAGSDPLRSAFVDHGRFDLYRWNDDPNDLDESFADWYYFAKPPHPTVFLNDVIGAAGLFKTRPLATARNSSLALTTCLFRIEDLPMVTTPSGSGIDARKAIDCHNWSHSFEYRFGTRRLVQTRPISRACDGAPGPQPP